jgi:DNA/RNA endonuclease G (NUC1)/fibronectin type 3 domain-containing protein
MRLFGRVTSVVAFLLTIITLPAAAQLRNHPRALDTGTSSISLTTLGSPVTENFDTLSNVALSTTNTALPTGWYITETGGGTRDNEQYGVDTGASTTGDIYSYGSAAATDRALGELRSGTLIPVFGAKFTNNTGTTITSLAVSYTGEQWRFGGVHSTVADRLDFQYSLNATDLSTGTYLDANALDFNPPVTAGTAGALDGNAAANRTAISSTITGLSIPNGATFFIRWTDVDATGADDGLAIDNFSVTVPGAPPNTAPTITPPANPAATVAQNAAPFTVGLSGSDDGSIYNWSATPGTGVTSVNVTAGQGTANVTYTVTLTAGFSGTATFTATLSDNVNTAANQAVNITVVAPPAAPTGLAATAGTGHIALTWSSVSGATSYNVKRSTTSGTEATIASPGTNSYDDTTSVDGTPYFYVVSAVGFGGEGANSSPEITATSMSAPTGLAATPGNAHVVLNWTAVAGATGYNVKRSTSTGTETTIASPATNTYDDVTAANATQYFYVVTATNANGESLASSEVNATPAAPGVLVLSQLYGGAGCGTVGCSTYKNDYVEIFNRGGSPVNVNGWSVQYAAATGTAAWQVTNLPNVSIQPGQYFLVAEGAGANGVSVLPTPDATGSIAMSATAAKVALVSSTTALNGACPSGNVVDVVGYGATANCSETAPAPAPSTTNAVIRANGGCTDAGNNSTDFAAAAAAPRNTGSPTHSCFAGPNNPPTITPPANPIATVAQNAPPFTVNLTGVDDGGIYTWSATPGTGIASVNVTGGQGTNTVTYTVTLTAGFTGTATFTATLSDNVNAAANQAVNITVNPPTPPPAPIGLNATAGNAHVLLAWNAVGGATSYNVKRSTSTGTETTIASPGTNSYDDTSAVNGTTYFYVVSAINAGGEGVNSSEVSATPQAAPPAPTGLTATPGDSHIALSWNAALGATTYTVARGTTPGGPYPTTFPGLVTNSYDDTSAVNGTAYYYVVTATSGAGTSGNSNEASATPGPPPPAPTGLTLSVGDAKVYLVWNPAAGATSYNVKRGTSTGTYTTNTSAPSASFIDNTVSNGTTYYYVVTAVNGAQSANSSEVSGTPNTASNLGVVFSQVYGGGGNGGATLKNDFFELFNRGSQTVNLSGWFVHYASAAQTTAWNSPPAAGTAPTALSGTIAPGHYYLVQESAGAGGTVDLPAADATGTLALGAGAGKVALTSVALISVPCPTDPSIADLVGYGPTANCFEGANPTAAPGNNTAVIRANNGCTDTNNNGNDFTVTASTPNPRNSGTPGVSCGALSNNPPSINAPANPAATVTQNAAPFGVNVSGNDDGGVYNWSATSGTGITSVNVSSGQGTSGVTYSVTLQTNFTGTASFTATLSDNINLPVSRTVNIQVNAPAGTDNPPTINPPANPITTVAQEAPPFTVGLTGNDDHAVYNWSATPGTGVATVNVTGGQSTGTVTYTVLVQSGFTGTATFTATLSDNVNPPANQTVNITVNPNVPPNHLVISQLYGGGGNSGATYQNDYVEIHNPSSAPVSTTGWSIQYGAATGTTWQVQPLGGIIGPGEYYLVQLGTGGAIGSVNPQPNIFGSINLSATAGKVALSNAGAPLGSCSDASIVDLVGFGSTSNCHEGSANAPAPSNTTSIFRKNGGATDSDQNGNDFLTGTPNPRRTTSIQEVGPSILSIDGTDSNAGSATAPRDGSVTVNFSEAVDVDANWFTLTCVTSGAHTNATYANNNNKTTWVITPNDNYIPGEQCTATVIATAIHDSDTDDSTPGTDSPPADMQKVFTVTSDGAGTTPENASVHLAMGNPSNATMDAVVQPNNYLISKPEYAESYSRDLGRPNWVSWHLTSAWTTGVGPRTDTFRPDPLLPFGWYKVQAFDFSSSGFDRGHMDPSADRSSSEPVNEATFTMTNMVAQAPGNNQGPWENLESFLRTLLPADELFIISGPNGVGGTGSNGGVTNTLANGHVTVPASTWKCALILPSGSGDPVSRVTASTQTLCVIMPNLDSIRPDDWHIYVKSVDQVEALTGYNLFSNVPAAIQSSIEAGTYGGGTNPPGAADQSVSTNEDTAKLFTLDTANATANPLTYTIVSGPSHGSVNGSNGSETYTPAPDFNGTDTFTYKVNDGSHDSNTATVTITVLEANDPPVATNDSKTATSGTQLSFPSSDLSANDSAGPANESTQTLTVTAVTATATTNGVVSLSSGTVSYTSTAGFSGPASFTYTVCDNGITAGLSDPRCVDGTVSVTVTAPLATHFSVSAPANVTSGAAFNVTVTALDASNTIVPSYSGTVHFTSSSAGTLPADYTFVGGDNGAHTFSVTLTSTGSQSITATDGPITGSANTTVAPPPATHFSVSAPANVTSGVAFNVTVTALDASNTIVPSYTGTVHFTSSSAGTLPADYTFVGGDNGAHTFSVTLTSTGSQSITATDGPITGSANTTVAPPPATHFSVSAPANVTSGVAFNVTVTALDASNTIVPSYTGTVHFTSSSAGSLPADYTFVGGDSGSHTFSVTLTASGAQSITATDGPITGSANTTVAPPPATHFSVTAPANVTSGVAFNVTVTALDASNTIVPSYSGTVHFTSSSAGSLPADYTFVGGDSGSHTFSVTLTSIGSQSITATDGSITGTADTTVAPPPATHFSVTAPANVTSGAAFSATVTALDASNTIVPSYSGTVHFTSSSAGSLPADYTFVGGDSGSHTFSVTLTSTGAQSITATDGPITGSANTTVAPPPATHFSVTAPAVVAPGSTFSVTVTALDASNNTVPTYSGTVHFTSSSSGTLPADYTFTGGDNGTHTFSGVTLNSSGSITATDTANASINGSASVSVVCPPGPAPTANASNSGPACAGTAVNLFASGNGSVFSWTGPGGFTSSQQNPTGITVAGMYTVTVSSPGPCGGSAQASTTVVINPIPSATITTSATVCASTAGNSASVPNAGAGATYAWSIVNGSITAGAATASITYTSGSSGAVHLAVTVTTSAGCSASSTADPVVAPRPTITLPATINAACGTTTVNIPFTLTGTGPWNLLWSDGVTQNGITSASSSRTVNVTTSTTLSAVVSDASCSNGSSLVTINVASAPVITTQPVSQSVAPSQQATFTVEASGANLHYQWFVKHGNGATLSVGTDSPSYTTTAEGNAIWFVKVSNDCGTVTSDSVTAQTIPPRHRPTSF